MYTGWAVKQPLCLDGLFREKQQRRHPSVNSIHISQRHPRLTTDLTSFHQDNSVILGVCVCAREGEMYRGFWLSVTLDHFFFSQQVVHYIQKEEHRPTRSLARSSFSSLGLSYCERRQPLSSRSALLLMCRSGKLNVKEVILRKCI